MLNRMSQIANKFALPPRFGTPGPNIWLEMSKLGNEHHPIDLGMGFPDYAPPKHVTEALSEVALTKDFLLHQYTKGFGHPRLGNILSKLYSKLVNRDINPDTEMLLTHGGIQALYTCFNAVLDKGDEVIIIEPFFEPYLPMVQGTGAIPRFIALKQKSSSGDVLTTEDYCLDKAELESMFNSKTKAIVVNTPNNPIGKVFNMSEMQMIADLCKKWNVLCVADEVYEWTVYKPNEHIRMATLPNMWERTITIGSAGKTFDITGWRTGWAYGPANLIKNLCVVHQNCIYTHLTPIQEAIAMAFEKEYDAMLNNPKGCYFYTQRDELISKRDFMLKAFSDSGLKPIAPQGGYMIMVDFQGIERNMDLSKETSQFKDVRLAKWLVKQGLMGVPASLFYSDAHKETASNWIRFCFIKRKETLQQAAEILRKLK